MGSKVTYYGNWTEQGCFVYRNDQLLPALPSRKLRDHSPDGFAWGYQGSGPAQLALALLYDALRDSQFALSFYQAFKREYVSRWPVNGNWKITQRDILQWVSNQLADANLN